MSAMAEAAKEFKDNNIDKKELKTKIKPIVADLKKSCEILKLNDVVDDDKNITDDEIAALKEFIEGAKKLIAEKKASFDAPAGESMVFDDSISNFIISCESMMIDTAEEKEEEGSLYIIGNECFNLPSDYSAFDDACESAIDKGFSVMEGFNWNLKAKYKAAFKEAKANAKAAKAMAKKGDQAGAKKAINEVVVALKQAKKEFEAEANSASVSDAVIGYFALGFRNMGLSLIGLIPIVGLPATFAISIKEVIVNVITVVTAIVNATKKELKPADLNLYTKQLLTNMDIMISHYEKIASKMDLKAAKNGNDDKNEPAGESMIFDDNSLDFDIFEEFFK